MNNNIIDNLLSDRIILESDTDNYLKESINIRMNYAIEIMELSKENIQVVFCSTVNKHTCLDTINNEPNRYYLIIDKHHLQLISCLDYLFYLYGNYDIKQPYMTFILDDLCSNFKKRKYFAVSILLAERDLLNNNATRALKYLDYIDTLDLSLDDCNEKVVDFENNLDIIKTIRYNYSYPYILNLYVYHEVAHIKFICDKDKYNKYIYKINTLITILKQNKNIKVYELSNISKEDIACDVYALEILFKQVFDETKDYDFEFVVESYINSVINLTIMDSVIAHDNTEKWYISCWNRIIITLNTLSIMDDFILNPNFIKSVQTCMHSTFKKFSNYYNEIMDAYLTMQNRYNNISEKNQLFSKDWNDEMNAALTRIRNIE